MMPWPIEAEAQRCATPTTPLTSGTATMPMPSSVTRRRSPFGIAWSMRLRIRRGGRSETREMTEIVTSTSTRWSRYGFA